MPCFSLKGLLRGKMPFCGGIVLVFLFFSFFAILPSSVEAWADLGPRLPDGPELELAIEAMKNETRPFGEFPKAKEGRGVVVTNVIMTAYNSLPWQTDDTPDITASGTQTRRGVVAANFLPFGTRVRFPDLYGTEEFVVEDRMNDRYHRRMDVWMEELEEARTFGVKWTTVEI